jgi:predicted alpha/beta hydrolase
LRDWKFSLDIGSMIPRGLRLYGEVCGFTLARAHARSGDEIAIASYLGNSVAFDNAIAEFAAAYADQNERDFKAFTEAIASGRLNAERGV